jgi:hypothetical protein
VNFRTALRAAALVLLLSVLAYWVVKGAHRGWSQNRVPVSKTDEITGIVFTTYDDRFIPGVEVLGAAVALSAALAAASFFVRSIPTKKSTP